MTETTSESTPGRTIRDCNKCCCKLCQEDRVKCHKCCGCLPRYLCLSFINDDANLGIGTNRVQHLGDGIYEPGLAGVTVSVLLTDLDTGTGTDNGTGESSCKIIIDGEDSWGFRTVVEAADYDCFSDEDFYIDIDGLVNPVSMKSGSIRIEPYTRITTPIRTNPATGCSERVCNNCLCFPYCICVIQKIEYKEDHPPSHPWEEETAQRRFKACWDSTLGELGGWSLTFPPEIDSCWPQYEVLITIQEDDDGDCQFYIDVNNGEFTGVSEIDLDCSDPNLLSASWVFDTTDPTDSSLPAALEFGLVDAGCGGYECPKICCLDFPATLTALVTPTSDDGGPCTDPFEVTLVRQPCSFISYRGTYDFDWNCDDDGPGTQTIDIGANPCGGSVYNGFKDECECTACTGDEDPGVAGCGSLGITLTDTNDPGGPEDFGSNGDFARCGYYGGEQVMSSSYPIYQEYYLPVSGLGGCCDSYYIVLTES